MSRSPDIAAVTEYELAIVGDTVTGFAAPAGGRLPCLLRLVADGETIALARATRYSAEAAARGLRVGWCGVELAGLHLAAAIAEDFEIRCALTDRLLLCAATPDTGPPPARPPLTVFELLAFIRREDICVDTAQILPFAEVDLRFHGVAGLLDAAYRTCLRRPADADVVARWEAAPPALPAAAALGMITRSAEYRDNPLGAIPGPFHPAFAFDLSPLDT